MQRAVVTCRHQVAAEVEEVRDGGVDADESSRVVGPELFAPEAGRLRG